MDAAGLPLRAFQAPKAGAAPEDCEDAYRFRVATPGPGQGRTPLALRVALADGATACSGSRRWAELLVRASLEAPGPFTRPAYFLPKLALLRRYWHQDAEAALPAARPWWADAALDQGAYATLLRFQLRGNRWRAEALGDSCLLHLRAGALLRSFPLETSEAFQAHPELIGSDPGLGQALRGRFRACSGRVHRGDLLLLATDAVACWLLATGEWASLLGRLEGDAPEAAFAAWVAEERGSRRLRNDDATLLVVTIP